MQGVEMALASIDDGKEHPISELFDGADILVGRKFGKFVRELFGVEGGEDDFLTQDHEDMTAGFSDWQPDDILPEHSNRGDGSGYSYRKTH